MRIPRPIPVTKVFVLDLFPCTPSIESAGPARAIRYAQANREIAATTTVYVGQGRLSAPGQTVDLEHACQSQRQNHLICHQSQYSVQNQTAAVMAVRATLAVSYTEIVVARTTNAVGARWSVVLVGMLFLLLYT